MMTISIDGTTEQHVAYAALNKRWHKISPPTHGVGLGGCWLVDCENETGYVMTVGIEPDGYTHS